MLVQYKINLKLYDITQAYPQAYPEGTLLHVIKPLYRIAKARELDISTLIYNLCLLVINSNADNFSIVTTFLANKEKMLKKAYYTLIIDASNMDNYKATLNLKQKGQGEKIKLIDINTPNRAAYIIENLNRRLRYIPITLINAKLIVFLGFILMLINKSTNSNNTFTICSNIIHYSLIKYKRVTRSVLAFKIYSMIIIERLSLPVVPLVICIDLYSLYKCLVKLRTTKEKRLIINIIALRHKDNPADAFTKASLNRALERFINSNKVIV
ncbi:hypothetical protein BU23DRAFT_585834 [Bimuria novae-zelandiae CBS 107.79]|uniref:Uncharacterized protein n=1 Tax=Bimuria novae-zelandiae CBS 107.79 TaxID=1447943 RepID=A0A6A5UGK9_9PLEO|nr:hypothetical protein BU23DRAFT_585834 [Bimuria novae-zelandiae CBS 107.79]